MGQDITTDGSTDQRGAERDEVFLRTSLILGKKTRISAQLVNISPTGFMARTMEPLSSDSKLIVVLPLVGNVPARIMWSLGGRIGGKFDTPIEALDYPKILTAIKTAKPNWQSSFA